MECFYFNLYYLLPLGNFLFSFGVCFQENTKLSELKKTIKTQTKTAEDILSDEV